MKIKFTIKEVNLDAGFCIVSAAGPDGVVHDFTIDTTRISVTPQDTEKQLANTISQVLNMELEAMYPAPRPKPTALQQMAGKSYEV